MFRSYRVLLELVLFFGGLWWGLGHLPCDAPKDYFQFWSAGEGAVVPGITNLYDRAQAATIAEAFSGSGQDRLARSATQTSSGYTATPTLYAAFRVVSSGDFEADLRRFRGVSLGLYLLAVLLAARLFAIPAPFLPVVVPVLLALNGPLRADIWLGNVARLQTAMVVVVMAALLNPGPKRMAFCGALVAFFVLFKPTSSLAAILLGGILLIDNRRLALPFLAGGLLAASAIVLASSAPFDGSVTWGQWVRRSHALTNVEMRSLLSYFSPRFATTPVEFLSATALAIPLAASVISARRFGPPALPSGQRYVAAFLAGLAAFVLAAPFVYAHHFLPLVPAGLYFAARPTTGRLSLDLLAKVLGCAGSVLILAVAFPPQPVLMMLGFAGALSLYGALVLEMSRPADQAEPISI